jgi:hypothetical protein
VSGPREQLEKSNSPAADTAAQRRWAKKQKAKQERRESKRLLEDAPKRREFRGYTG